MALNVAVAERFLRKVPQLIFGRVDERRGALGNCGRQIYHRGVTEGPMRLPVILILAFLIWFSYGTIIQSGAHAQGLVITSPRNGAVLPMQQQAVIEAEFKPPVDLVFTGIQARIEAAGGGTNLVIAEGDLRTISSSDRLRASWNVAEVVPGDYVITVTATAGGRTGKDTVKVTVHPIPVVSFRVTSLQ